MPGECCENARRMLGECTEIAEKEHLPKQYVQQIFMKLRRAGFVKSIRGTRGGFALAKPAAAGISA